MPTYKILGIYSFAETLKKMYINDPVILKAEKNNIQSKNAIGIYNKEHKKLGYLPIEKKEELNIENNIYKITKLCLHSEIPTVEISRSYNYIGFIPNIEFPFIKKIKYKYKNINISKELSKAIESLILDLKLKRIKIKKSLVTYVDDFFINLILETAKGFETFNLVTYNYYTKYKDFYEEIYEKNLIDVPFFRELLVHRIEKYFEVNYKNVEDLNENVVKFDKMTEYHLHEPINDYTLDVFNIYFNYLINNDDTYLKDYNLNIFENIKLFFNKYTIELGNFYYCHDLEIYGYLYYLTDNAYIEIINNTPEYIDSYIYKCYLAKKDNLILYNPVTGYYYYKNVNLDFNLFSNIDLKDFL
jgi:hypothetical protein